MKLFSCSTLLSMEFKLLINTEIAKIDESAKASQIFILLLINVKMVTIVGILRCEQDKFHAHLS